MCSSLPSVQGSTGPLPRLLYCISWAAPAGLVVLSCWLARPFAAAVTEMCILAVPCQSVASALLLQGSPKPSVIPEGTWDVGVLSYILQEPKVGRVAGASGPVCCFD